MAKKLKKTNAERILDTEHIPYSSYQYDNSVHDEEGTLGEAAAKQLGVPAPTVFKTLVTEGDGQIVVCVIPVTKKLNLKAVATAANIKKLEMIPVAKINAITGYIRGGCSPIGMKKLYPTFIHQSALELDHMIISAGHIGQQVGVAPHDLIQVTKAITGDFVF